MAETNIQITQGSGTVVDTFQTAGGQLRQAVVLGDPSINANVASIGADGSLKVDNSTHTQPISASSLPLPTGAATAANQTTANNSLSSIDTKTTYLPGFAIPPYDYIGASSTSTTDVYVYKSGGSGGTTLATITVTYTGTDKGTIQSVAKT